MLSSGEACVLKRRSLCSQAAKPVFSSGEALGKQQRRGRASPNGKHALTQGIFLIKSHVPLSNTKINLQALFGPFLYRRVTTEHTLSFKARVTNIEVVHHEASAPSWYGDFPSSSRVQDGSGLLLVLARIPTPLEE